MLVLERMSEKIWFTRIKEARKGADAEDIAKWYQLADTARNPYLYRGVPKALVPFFLYVITKVEEFTNSNEQRQKYMNVALDILSEKNQKNDKLVYSVITAFLHFSFDQVSELNKLQWKFTHPSANGSPNVKTELDAYQAENELQINSPLRFMISDYMNLFPEKSQRLFPDYILAYEKILNYDVVFTSLCSDYNPDVDNEDIYNLFYNQVFENLAKIKLDENLPINMDKYFQRLMKMYCSDLAYSFGLVLTRDYSLTEDEQKLEKMFDLLLENLPAYAEFFPLNYKGYTVFDNALLNSFKTYIKAEENPVRRKILLYAFVTNIDAIKSNVSDTSSDISFVYDFYHNKEYNGEQLFLTQRFRTDFDRKFGIFKEFTDEQLDVIGTCVQKNKQNFSFIINIIKEKGTKQDAVDSLVAQLGGCTTELTNAGLTASPEVTIQLKNTSLENQKQRRDQLMQAIRDGKIDDVKKLAGTLEINYRDENEDTPLHVAIETGNEEIVRYLLMASADPEMKNKQGDTALLHAIRKGNKNIVNLLGSLAVKVDVKDKNGKTAKELAAALPAGNIQKAIQEDITKLEKATVINMSENLSKNIPPMENKPVNQTNITASNVPPKTGTPPPPNNDPEPPLPPEPTRMFNLTGQAENIYEQEMEEWRKAKAKHDAWVSRHPNYKPPVKETDEGVLAKAAKKIIGLRRGGYTRTSRKRYATTRKLLKK